MGLVTTPKNCDPSVKKAIQMLAEKLSEVAAPTFSDVTLTSLTASSLVATDGDKALESVTIGASLTYSSSTLNTIQNIRITDSPEFAGVTVGSVVLPTLFTTLTEPTGFADRTATLSWDDGTRTLTITGSHDIYINGVKTTKSTDSIQIADTTGIHYIYYNASGVLTENTTHPGFSLPLMASVYWNTTVGFDKGLAGEERHGIIMDGDTHGYLHETVGARYESGLTGTFDNTTITIATGEWHDEDIEHNPAEQTTCTVLYKNGSADYEWDAGSSVYYKLNGTALRYNNGNALTDCTANRYMAMWIFVTNDISTPIVALMGQREDITLASARANNTYESLTLGTLPFQEMKLLYRVILRSTGSPPTYVEAQDFRTVSNLPAGTYVATSHSVLSGLLNDDHTQYALLAGRTGGQTLYGSDTTAEDLTLGDNSVDGNTITVTQAIAAYNHIHNLTTDIDHDALTNFVAGEHFLQSTITTVGTIATGTWEGTDIGIAHGGTGQSTAQAAIDALTAVSSATNEHVLTKDTATGNAIFKAAAGAGFTSHISVYLSTDQTITKSVWTKIELDSESYDNDNEFATYKFTADAEGYYHITTRCAFLSMAASKGVYLAIKKNSGANVAAHAIYATSAGTNRLEASADVYFNGTTDYVESYCFHDDTVDRDISGDISNTNLHIHRFA